MNLLNLFNGKSNNVSSIKYKKPIDQQLINKLIDYLQNYYQHLSKHGSHKIMVGIDGEINSLLAAKLLTQALRQAQGGNVVAMVFDIINPAWTNSAVEFCKKLGLETYVLQRGTAYQTEIATYKLHKGQDIKKFYKKFINYHLLIQSEHLKAKVVDTADKSDRLLGTRPEGFYGHLMPFYPLYKSELYELAKFLGIPVPQTNDWDKIDPVLYLLTEQQLKVEEISQQFNIDLHWLRSLKIQINKQLFQTTPSQFLI